MFQEKILFNLIISILGKQFVTQTSGEFLFECTSKKPYRKLTVRKKHDLLFYIFLKEKPWEFGKRFGEVCGEVFFQTMEDSYLPLLVKIENYFNPTDVITIANKLYATKHISVENIRTYLKETYYISDEKASSIIPTLNSSPYIDVEENPSFLEYALETVKTYKHK